jgi:hypothetical protein
MWRSPMFPAVEIGGFFVGLGAVIFGAVVLLSDGGLQNALRRWAGSRGAPPSRLEEGTKPPLADPLLPVRILRLAKERGGELTTSTVAMELDVPLDQAVAGLEECVRRGSAFADYDIDRQHALYRFPEFQGPGPGGGSAGSPSGVN